MRLQANSQALLDELPHLDADALEERVRYHNGLYWDQNEPEIDDPTYDKLVEALRTKRPNSPVLDELGGETSTPEDGRQFASVQHERKMLSLDKAYDDERVNKWRSTFSGGVVITPKIDGVACSIRYDERGKMTVAATRGSGVKGDDITANAKQVTNIPAAVDEKATAGQALEVRGEVYMALSRFEKHYKDDYENPRNLTAGKLKQKDPKETGRFGLRFLAYDLLGGTFATEIEKHQMLDAMGFDRPPAKYVAEDDDVVEAVHEVAATRTTLDYETDGVVMKADTISEQERLGATAHHPRFALAYKFQGEAAQSKLVRVEWSIGRSGVVTPVAVVEPVRVGGVTITNVSLHNYGFIQKLGLKSESLLEVERAGDVIPHIRRVLSHAGDDIPMPDYPVRVDGDFMYVLDSTGHPDVIKKQVAHFLKVIDVQGFGTKIISALVDKGLIKRPADIFKLEVADIASLERMGEKSANNFIRERERKRELPFPTFLTALGLPEVGSTVSAVVCDAYETLDDLKRATSEDLAAIHGVGPSIAASIASGLVANADDIDALLEEVKIVRPAAAVTTDHELSGKSVVFTGKMATLERKAAQKKVKDLGGKAPSSVTKDLDILVIGDDGSPLLGSGNMSTKHKSAEKLIAKGASIQIISESDFIKMLDG